MRKKSTRLLSAALAVCMTVTVLPMSAFASGVAEFESGGSSQETAAAQSGETGGVTGDVVINEAFPDPNFCKYVEEQYDRDKDGKLNQNELARVAAVTKLEFSKSDYAPDGEKIESLEGIEYFTSLKRLYCVNNKLSALDVSKNRELEKLNCEYNQLSALNVSNHPKLDELICNHNQLIELNVSNCPALTQLQCNYNHLSALDVSSNQALWELSCANNQLIELDVRSNPELLYLATSSNPLSELDVSQNPKLSTLYCRSNQLSELDLKNNKILEFFDCSKNHLTSLNIDGRPMGRFTCQGNSYDIVVDETNCYDLSKLPGHFDATKVENDGRFDPESKILTVGAGTTEITYTYNCGTSSRGNIIKARFTLNVTHHTHTYGDWLHDETDHWQKCTDSNCPEPEESVKETKAPHDFDEDGVCKVCGYQRETAVPDAPAGGSGTDNIQGALSAVVVGAAAGVIIYEAGTGIYRVINMPGIPMPSNRIELAELLWEHAGKPEPVSTARYSDIDEGDTDAQKAAHWAVEQDLMKDNSEKNTFNPYFPVGKLRTCLTWNAAKEKGLFDKTEE